MEEIVEEYCNKSLDLATSDNCTDVFENMTTLFGVTPEAVLVPLTFTLIFSFGLVGNILLILSFVKFKKLNAPHNIFVINLAVGDLIMLLVSLPFNSTWYTIPYWPYGLIICKLSFFIETLATSVTIGTITVLSVERFFLISGNRSNNKKSFAIIIVVVIWTLSFLLAVPDMLSASIVVKEHNGRTWEYCYSFSPYWGTVYPKVYTMMRFLMLFVIPICLISPIYLAIAYNIYFKSVTSKYPSMKTPLRNNSTSNSTTGKSTSSTDRRKRLALSVLGLVWAFILCWLPRHIYLLWFYFDPNVFDHFWHVFKIVGFCLVFANCAVNPIVFYILDKKFRQYVHIIILCKTSQRMRENTMAADGQTIALTDIQQTANKPEAV